MPTRENTLPLPREIVLPLPREITLPRVLEAVRPRIAPEPAKPAEPIVASKDKPEEPAPEYQEEPAPDSSTLPAGTAALDSATPILAALAFVAVSSKVLPGLVAPKPEPVISVGPPLLLGLAVLSVVVVVLDNLPPIPEPPPVIKEQISKLQASVQSALAERKAEAEARAARAAEVAAEQAKAREAAEAVRKAEAAAAAKVAAEAKAAAEAEAAAEAKAAAEAEAKATAETKEAAQVETGTNDEITPEAAFVFLSSDRLAPASLDERVRWLEGQGVSSNVIQAATARLLREEAKKQGLL